MTERQNQNPLFPEFEKFATDSDMLAKVKGALVVKVNRIIGRGKTKANGLDLPPAAIERKMELGGLTLPDDMILPDEVKLEIIKAQEELENELQALKTSDGTRKLAITTLRNLSVSTGFKDNCYFAGRLILVPTKRGQSWSWSLTRHYPLISNIPPDTDYLVQAYEAAENLLKEVVMSAEVFEYRLDLAWKMARHFSDSDDVYLVDVAKMFRVSGQSDQFWKTPKRVYFSDLPEASFIANLINWRRKKGVVENKFEFIPATLHQAHGPKAKVFFMPINEEGTQDRPIVYLRKNL